MIKKPGGRKNFGYGKKLDYAVSNILRDKFGVSRFGTQATYRSRLRDFEEFLNSAGIKNLAEITRSDIAAYADSLRNRVADGDCAVATAVNYLSAANILLSHARHDEQLAVSPSNEVGRRNYVRTVAPFGLRVAHPSQLQAASSLGLLHGDAIIAVLGLARFAGVRFREASLTPLDDALAEIRATGSLNIVHGCKGGRTEDRLVPGSGELVEVLEIACARLGRQFVIPTRWNYIQWSYYAYRHMPKVAACLGISRGFHDLRASYACERYSAITGADAPVVAGRRLVSRELDRLAREQISRELGHGKAQICASYTGSAR